MIDADNLDVVTFGYIHYKVSADKTTLTTKCKTDRCHQQKNSLISGTSSRTNQSVPPADLMYCNLKYAVRG